jgi:hypothetical protein
MHHIDTMLSLVESRMLSPQAADDAMQFLILDDANFSKFQNALKDEFEKAGDATGAGKKGKAKPG